MGTHRPQVYTIAAHRGFADALVAGLLPRYRDAQFGLARLTLLLPSQRAARTITEAFVRASGGGLLLPRMVVVGDLDLDETLGPLLDPIGENSGEIPPAADQTERWLELARLLKQHDPRYADETRELAAARLRHARELGATMDRLLVEGIAPGDLFEKRVLALFPDLAGHWQASTRLFAEIQARWLARLEERGEVDAPTRRNLLFDKVARKWRDNPPAMPIVAAGVTSASPSLARLLRTVSELPQGAVILPDLDLALDDAVWDELGLAGQPEDVGGEPISAADALTHPQYHLKLLLNRMGVNRAEVEPWHRAGLAASRPARSKAISNLFLPPGPSARWATLDAEERRLAGVSLMESANPEEEAQAIAIRMREALLVDQKRVALVTPDRGLASRVVAHLRRWNIEADDTAGTQLSQTPPARLMLLAAELLGGEGNPVALSALLQHPLVKRGDDEARREWLRHARAFDRALRGPRPAPGLDALGALAKRAKLADWWAEARGVLEPLFSLVETLDLADALDLLARTVEDLSSPEIWGGADGRALAALVEDLRQAARKIPTTIEPAELPAILREAMDRVAVRPPWGGHPRVSVYGLLESRMTRAELVICGGMHEGSWPATPSPDPLLPPAIMRALGVPDGEFRIGLSAHDLSAALGAPEVILSHARRDESGPVIPSRFILRVRALMGEKLARAHEDGQAVAYAQEIDNAVRSTPAQRPAPKPEASQRDVPIRVTALDRLLGDPYQFYASEILKLSRLDPLDAEPSAAWKGTAAHDILERWHKGEGDLATLAQAELAAMSAHPLVRHLWWPRLGEALDWVREHTEELAREGRVPIAIEAKGEVEIAGARLRGRADRIDRLADGTLAIMDYKTGAPPSRAQVEKGFALQLGLIGLMARAGAFDGVEGAPEWFEYWSLARAKDGSFGYVDQPVKTSSRANARGIEREEFLAQTEAFLRQGVEKYIRGDAPFTARENPDYEGYTDYDHLMRLEEWIASAGDEA